MRDLLAWLAGEKLVEGHPFRDIKAQPAGPYMPEVWILGSSSYGAQVAAHFGLPYCFAHFITDGEGAAEALDIYRDLYRPSPRHPAPHVAIAVWALAADTDTEAERLFSSRALWRLGRDRGSYSALPTVADALEYPYSDRERARVAEIRAHALCGTGAAVMAQIEALAAGLGAAEAAIITTVADKQARRRSYTLLAEAAQLRPASDGTALAADGASAPCLPHLELYQHVRDQNGPDRDRNQRECHPQREGCDSQPGRDDRQHDRPRDDPRRHGRTRGDCGTVRPSSCRSAAGGQVP